MLTTRNSDISPQDEYYSDALLTPPSFSKSVFDRLALGYHGNNVGINTLLNREYSKTPEGSALLSTLDAIRISEATPGIGLGQKIVGGAAAMIGFGLNPWTWAAGAVGGAVARGVAFGAEKLAPEAVNIFMRRPIKELLSEPIGKYIPSMIGKEGAEKTLSSGLVSETTLKNFGTFAGSFVPQAIADNYKADTNHIEWGGVAREAGEMGAFGMAIGSIPFAWGILRAKVNRGLGHADNAVVAPSDLDLALEQGHITKEDHQWFKDYLEHEKDPGNLEMQEKLKKDGTAIIQKEGHKVNTVSHEASFEIIPSEHIKSLQTAVADQISSHLPEEYRTSLSDFIVHDSVDNIRANPKSLDGVRGYVDSIDRKMEAKPVKLAEADRILDEHLTKSVKENMDFSQKELFSYMKKAQFESSHVKHLPVNIPENITKHMQLLEKINHLKQKIKQQKPKNIASLYRGRSETAFGFKNLKEAGVKEIDLAKEDIELGKGFWYAESLEHAKKYGSTIEKIEGEYKIFDVDKTKNQELKKLYDEIHKRYITPEGHVLTSQLIKEFTDKLKKKGYKGIKRTELAHDNYGRPEIMFFEKPSSSKKAIPNKQTVRRIEQLEKKLPKLLTPKEELEQLRKTLLSERGLPKNWEHSNAYHRLLDLSNVWRNARTLLDRVHLEHEYNRQAAFRDVAKQILKISDSNLPKLANQENVIDYLKKRIEGNISKVKPISEVASELEASQKVPINSEEVLTEQESQIKNTKATDAREDFVQSMDIFKEFKNSEGIFKNLIACVRGSLGG